VGSGKTTINGTTCAASVRAINPNTRTILWQHCMQSGTILGPVIAFNGVVAVAQGHDLNFMNAATGAHIVSYHDGRAGSYFYSGPSVSNGQVFVGNIDGYLSEQAANERCMSKKSQATADRGKEARKRTPTFLLELPLQAWIAASSTLA
jgi:outer membrane protein assembly factor BamB